MYIIVGIEDVAMIPHYDTNILERQRFIVMFPKKIQIDRQKHPK